MASAEAPYQDLDPLREEIIQLLRNHIVVEVPHSFPDGMGHSGGPILVNVIIHLFYLPQKRDDRNATGVLELHESLSCCSGSDLPSNQRSLLLSLKLIRCIPGLFGFASS